MTRSTAPRTLLRAGAILVFLALVGATYQGVTTALERRTFPRPGGMVPVGDHQLHIYCVGSGSPTVVLEAPAAGMSSTWGSVQPGVARVTRVCAYDRAGLGWSERGDAAYDPAAVADELHGVLAEAGERGPFVIAGHGLGAAFAMLFASRFGAETAGVILVDAPFGEEPPREPAMLVRYPWALPWLARTGILRASGGLCAMTTRLREPSGAALCAFLNRPDHLTRTADELSQWRTATRLADDARVRPDIPIARVEAAGHDRVAFLAPAQSEPVTAAILAAVRRARAATKEGGERLTPDGP